MDAQPDFRPATATASALRQAVRYLIGLFGETTRKALLALVAQAIVSGTNFLTTVMIGRYCGLEELGVYALGFAVLLGLSVIHESLLWSPYAVFSNRLRESERGAYAGNLAVLQGVFSAGGLLLLIATAGLISYGWGPAGLAAVLWALVPAAPCYLLRHFVRRLLMAQLDVLHVVGLDLVVALLQFGGFLLLLQNGLFSAATACLVVGAACVLPAVAWLLRTSMEFTFTPAGMRREWRRHWSFGRWICVSQLSDVSQRYVLYWLLAGLVGTLATGVYAAYGSVVVLLNPLLLGIGSVLVPKAAQAHCEGGPAELRRVIRKTSGFLVVTVSLFALFVCCYGEEVLCLLYGGAAAGSWHLLVLLALTAVAGAAGFAADNGLVVMERPDINFRIGLAGLALILLVAGGLIPFGGVTGAAIAGLAGAAFAALVKCLAFVRLTRPDQAHPRRPQQVRG